jgi:hypothetical protein
MHRAPGVRDETRTSVTQARGCARFSRHSSRDGLYFAALEAEIAQRAVIEVPKRVIDSPRLPTLPVARVRSACDCTGCPHRRDYNLDDYLTEGERAKGVSAFIPAFALHLNLL